MTKYVGAYTAVLGELDALVFTAGIGENSAPLRAALCGKLASLGVKLDERANSSGGPCISTADSGVSVWVIPTDEELMIGSRSTRWRSSAPARLADRSQPQRGFKADLAMTALCGLPNGTSGSPQVR